MPDQNCIFCKIISNELPASIVAQNEHAIAFHDRSPQAPVHLLIVPRLHLRNLNDTSADSADSILGSVSLTRELAKKYGNQADSGFRIQINNEASAGQVVFHMHWHFLAGF